MESMGNILDDVEILVQVWEVRNGPGSSDITTFLWLAQVSRCDFCGILRLRPSGKETGQ